MKDFECRFFVRVKDTNSKADIENAFGNVSYIQADDVTGELAFLTDKISESKFEDKIKSLDLIYRIRTAL